MNQKLSKNVRQRILLSGNKNIYFDFKGCLVPRISQRCNEGVERLNCDNLRWNVFHSFQEVQIITFAVTADIAINAHLVIEKFIKQSKNSHESQLSVKSDRTILLIGWPSIINDRSKFLMSARATHFYPIHVTLLHFFKKSTNDFW